MPHSARENDALVRDFVITENIKTVLDVGAGSGTYARLLGDLCTLDAIEIWQPYVKQFGLRDLYRDVSMGDIRDIAWASGPGEPLENGHPYNLIIFGDVMEHMTREQMLEVWQWAHQQADWGLISIPIVHWPQGTEEGNPFEAHIQDHIDVDQLRADLGPFTGTQMYEMTGTFIKRFT